MIWAPRFSRSGVDKDLTEAAVPTGINTGVWIWPWGVVRRPVRPWPGSGAVTENSIILTNYMVEMTGLTVKSGCGLLK